MRFKGPELMVLGLFLILLLPKVFQQGMFFDGLIYSSVSNNLASGQGSVWDPSFSKTIWLHFHEHPTFALWLQSLFLQLFGGAFFAEKVYSLVMALICAYAIVRIWKKLFDSKEIQDLWWLPLFLWIFTSKVFWVFNNNMLEGTLSAMTLLSAYFSLIAVKDKKPLHLLWAGLFLLLSFLTKGPVGLFPLAFIPLYFIVFHKNISFSKAVTQTLIVLVSFAVFIGLLFLIFPESYTFLHDYLNAQVLSSIKGEQRVGSRLNFLKDIILELLPMTIFSLVFTLIRIRSIRPKMKQFSKHALFFFLIGCSAILPLFISPKLSQFYIVPGIPFMAISLSALIAPEMSDLMKRLAFGSVPSRIFQFLGLAMISFALVFTIIKAGTIERDHELHHDMAIVAKEVQKGAILSISPSMKEDWNTIAHFQRFQQISFDLNNDSLTYILKGKNEPIPEGYELMPLDLQRYSLMGKK
ncbi:MAG: glycosyltransferase family 39 protein [Crocinitomicaceae bacterium]|nr:glycosyltransferase family 39 protein [Crocinitomicaceae bacterium]